MSVSEAGCKSAVCFEETFDQLHVALQAGIKEIQNGDTVDAASAFAQFRERHR